MKLLTGFFRFWYDFLFGDCWPLAVGVLCIMGGLAVALHAGLLPLGGQRHTRAYSVLPIAAGVAIMLLLVLSVLLELRETPRKG